MQKLSELSNDFFKKFYSDLSCGSAEEALNMRCLENALRVFLESGKKEDAFSVYYCFCEIFKTFGQGRENADGLLEMLSDFEYTSDEPQSRCNDRCSHSVYVFALGLAIYTGDSHFRNIFDKFYGDIYGGALSFLEFWGLASLFHEIGKPVQFEIKRILDYFKRICGTEANEIRISLGNSDGLFSTRSFALKVRGKTKAVTYSSFDDLLKGGLTSRFSRCSEHVDDLISESKNIESEPIECAYFGAAILANKLISVPNFEMHKAHQDILTAIFLHNNSKVVERFDRRSITASTHPLAYLLTLCNKLQIWDQTVNSYVVNTDPMPRDAQFNIDPEHIKVMYTFDSYTVPKYRKDRGTLSSFLNQYYLKFS